LRRVLVRHVQVKIIVHRHPLQPYSENKELCGSDRFEGDPIPQPLNAPRELVDEMGLPTVIKVMGPQLLIGFRGGRAYGKH
jgi:hypothetical protein